MVMRRFMYSTVGNDDFIMTFTLSADDSITLPLVSSGTYDFVVDWGDGNQDTITAFNQAERIHTYTGSPAGDYIVTITGTLTAWLFGSVTTSRAKLKSVDQWGNTGFNNFGSGFQNCTNLISVASDLKFYGTNLNGMFALCSSLTSIPSGLFYNCTTVITFADTFNGAGITTIPSGLFDNCTVVTNFRATFNNCSSLTTIPSGLFDFNTSVDNFSFTFRLCSSLTTIPSGLFDNCTTVITFANTFRECSSLTSIPTNIFNNNVNAENYTSCFFACTSLASSVSVLVAGMTMTAVTSTNSMFSGCTSLTGNGQDLIDKPKAAGFVVSTATNSGSYRTFFNCSSLTDFATIPAEWK